MASHVRYFFSQFTITSRKGARPGLRLTSELIMASGSRCNSVLSFMAPNSSCTAAAWAGEIGAAVGLVGAVAALGGGAVAGFWAIPGEARPARATRTEAI